jgi:hypothetical protein
MGQYHYCVNLSKQQFLHPHIFGQGLKLLEMQGGGPGGINDALMMLLAVSSGRGGGDFQSEDPLIGSWGGDRIAFIGDYAEASDLLPEDHAESIYARCGNPDGPAAAEFGAFKDISERLIALMEREYEIVYWGEGWRQRAELNELIAGWQHSHGHGDRTAVINGAAYAMSDVLAKTRTWLAKHPDFRMKAETAKLTAAQLELTPIGPPDTTATPLSQAPKSQPETAAKPQAKAKPKPAATKKLPKHKRFAKKASRKLATARR